MQVIRLSAYVALSWTAIAAATPANKAALVDYLGTKSAIACRTCHVGEMPTADDFEHNAFGLRLVALRKELRAAGKPVDLRTRLETAAEEDSDGDGTANLVELLTGHNPGDAADRPTAAELRDADTLRSKHRKHLAAYPWQPFEPVRRPTVPAIGEPHPVDAFLEAARREQQVIARPPAPKSVLLRRVYLDLIGQPPTPADLDAFLADDAPDAFDRVVDRLLASPQYGERWGRHWMDVWRYSDWAGYGAEVRESQPHIWRWRDWIVESLNADAGYDRMVREMLAGDEIAPTDPRVLRATGYLVRNYYKFNRNSWLDSTVEHTAKAFLGMTLNCARCHDHMYDPLSQRDYYSFRAFFEPHQVRTDRVPGQPDPTKLGLVRTYDVASPSPTYLFTRGDDKQPDQSQPCPPAVPAALRGPALGVAPVPLPPDASHPDRRAFVIDDAIASRRNAVDGSRAALTTVQRNHVRLAIAALTLPATTLLADARPMTVAQADVLAAQASLAALEATLQAEEFEIGGRLATQEGKRAAELATFSQRQDALATARRNLLAAEAAPPTSSKRGAAAPNLIALRAAVAKAESDLLLPPSAEFVRRPQSVYPTISTGRRLALARWITDRDNPLAARVAVNHIWARHFGQPLVSTMFDFGRNGQPPTHPALLDWLAAEFVEGGWSMKRLHRLLVTSRAYQLDSRPDPASAALDPDNRWYWRMTPRRLEAEAVRDSVLAIAGRIDPTMGGPDLDHATGLTTFRRSLYYRHANEKQMTFLSAFDAANVNECYRRHASIVPQQALALANSSLVHESATALANRLTTIDDAEFVRQAFQHVLTRSPHTDEARDCEAYLRQPGNSRDGLVRVLFKHHEFVTIR
ncbi:MAG: DUF1549 and DUF1553 domain-containing protein [Gemmataceae bacterium]